MNNGIKKFANIIAIFTAIYHIYIGFFGIEKPLAYYSVTVSLFLCLTFLYFPLNSKEKYIGIFDIIPSVLSLLIGVYLCINYDEISIRPTMIGEVSTIEFILGIFAILLVLEATRRTIGMSLVWIAVISLIYCYVGKYIPGMFGHSGFTIKDIVESMYLTLDGIYGKPIAVVATLVIQFILFGAFLESSGAATFFVDISMSLVGRMKGAAGHIGTVAAALFGMMIGSPTATTVAVGSFSIPMMKKTGFSSTFSGAITAVSSTGSALVPPVMGTAVFLMAEITGIPYADICVAAIFPAVLYFLSCTLMIYFEASKKGIEGYKKENLPSFFKTLPISTQYIIPIALLIILLMRGFPPAYAAIVASFFIYLASFLRKKTRITFSKLCDTMVATSKTSIAVMTSCASAGIVVGAIMLTGLGGKFASIVIALSQQNLILALILTMTAALILGMGMPLPVVYILVAVLCGPAIVSLGIPIIAAHLFLVYFACISALTPPVAVASYAASAISGGNPLKTGFAGFKYAIAGFIIPYVMVYNQSILLIGSFKAVLFAVISATIGIFALSAAISKWVFTRLTLVEQLFLFLTGILLIFPGWLTDTIGIGILIPILFINYYKNKTKSISKHIPENV
ncbi:TRAP transporter permease [Desulfobacula toluolica]|uniref:TRAP transporter, 4TM/12TM fusion protein n=1 Tax=Desulfobacula toluolica (strain DSM 7467 / Tol2) TaxID=651182 RepID=K0NHR3_DESTT|nr:TRAP transporter fused permease subunit [Desulfobacula toluolica]CCK80847.1 TRAP transporter, 4TM/12TM fusion protein [Desulfobacula toluolica Tol2]CCK80866.1 TRAP transporter, 4TM/12TM fusion protein [Desulfobacula toluolica Tol2]CCK80883.1 TRAP transporter, 4TM/12TM fusion protein [Desulfobacula toluolica Tol2]CCK80904.1 TRAP transporter, 4TM/12TM fusion protein [Desulfobacula toluolica Tol2]CCK80923.1 TRAP transporter, 4TM/12TM fusion protein [Desulfobacula toluolica Tol2]